MTKTWTLPSNEEFVKEFAPELLVDEKKRQKVRVSGNKPTVFNFVMDVSGSMSEYYRTLVDSFNTIMVPGLKGVKQNQLNTVLVGGILFSDKLIPLWPGFKPVKGLDDAPLNINRINADGLRAQTALYLAMVSALSWTRLEMDKLAKDNLGVQPRGKICVLTDGANNREPLDAAVVRQALNQHLQRDKQGNPKIQCTLAFLKTGQGLTEQSAQRVAEATGFEFSGFYDLTTEKIVNGKKQTPQQMFCHFFDLWSKEQLENKG
ncbi:MAG: hypothetical protein Q8P32_04085 [Candidatus Komeilibacteria bacterium]|nr:hypothetical protein [Candidatus Komeilibacteria bacterium]